MVLQNLLSKDLNFGLKHYVLIFLYIKTKNEKI